MHPKLNNEGETAQQEKTEPVESKKKEAAEIKAYKKVVKHSHDLKPNETMPGEHLLKK